MCRQLWVSVAAIGLAAALAPRPARAQVPAALPYRMNAAFGAPGLYGMSYGAPSFGMTRTYSSYSSSYGGGYGYGYAPYGLLPGRFGVGLWRPGFTAPGYAYGGSYYRTFAVPYTAGSTAPVPPVGAYAPGFGPAAYWGW